MKIFKLALSVLILALAVVSVSCKNNSEEEDKLLLVAETANGSVIRSYGKKNASNGPASATLKKDDTGLPEDIKMSGSWSEIGYYKYNFKYTVEGKSLLGNASVSSSGMTLTIAPVTDTSSKAYTIYQKLDNSNWTITYIGF